MSSASKKNIEQIFHDGLNHMEITPPDAVWMKIQPGLPKQKVPFFTFFRLAIAASMIIAVLTFLKFNPFADTLNKEVASATLPIRQKLNNSVKQLASGFHKNKPEPTSTNTNSGNSLIAAISTTPFPIKTAVASEVKELELVKHTTIATELKNASATIHETGTGAPGNLLASNDESILPEEISLHTGALNPSTDFADYNRNEPRKVTDRVFIDEQLKRQFYFVKGFNIGMKSEFNNTWILVSTPQTTFDNPQVNFKINGGLAYGLTAGYDFSNKFGIQGEWHMVSQMAQRYEVSKAYTIQDRYIKLTYMNFPVIAKFKMSRLTALDKNPIVINYIMGLQYGIIRTGDVLAAKSDEMDIRQQINSQQWSVVLGINYDLYLSQHLFFSIGGRTTFGKDIRPALFSDVASHKSRNFTLGLEAGLHYKLFNKQ